MMDTTHFSTLMPAMYAHKGTWEGDYIHMNPSGNIIDQHKATVRCEFPTSGPHPYIQYNHFTWGDGREAKAKLPGTFRDGRLWWDTDTFSGSAWETHDGLILLNLDRKDDPGARFFEIIIMGDNHTDRARTWHWFKDGTLYKRTLCNERRVSAAKSVRP